ncbi:DUF4331 family protein [Kitasatospora sp. NPDC048298]|uniref:DUF4331 family protein n=1 Tax=Kitasatospora sp. NPDC048298 TaxID=3364049 RepID=UPI0037116C2D
MDSGPATRRGRQRRRRGARSVTRSTSTARRTRRGGIGVNPRHEEPASRARRGRAAHAGGHVSSPQRPQPPLPLDDARLDMTDLFAFTVPGDRTVLILNVNPVAPTGGQAFHPDAVYRVNVDTDGDHRSDVAYSFVFSPPEDGRQGVTVLRATDEQARSHEALGQELFIDVPVNFGAETTAAHSGPYTFYAGFRSDPFFADLDGIVAKFQWTGVDWGADKNVFAIVLEVPNAELGAHPEIG